MIAALVTGANGFVGQHLVRELLNSGRQVVGLVQKVGVESELSIETIGCDIRDEDSVTRAVNSVKPDEIYHLAAISRPDGESIRDYYETNVFGTLNVLQPAIQIGSKVLVVSSAYAYGDYEGVISEKMPLQPINPYGASKAAQDLLAGSLSGVNGCIIRVRPFNHTGIGQNINFVVPAIIRRILDFKKNGSDIVLGNTETVRDFLDVRDVAKVYRVLMDEIAIDDVFNVCSGNGYSIAEIYDICRKQLGVDANFSLSKDLQRNRGDIKSLVGDSSKLLSSTSWRPSFSFEKTIADLILDLS